MNSHAAKLASAREQMIVEHLGARGIRSSRVLDAMRRVPRERFVGDDFSAEAYDDKALPIGCGQTISQPFIVALMTQALALEGGERVLEIGTGCGYQTAVLAELASEVFTIERHAELADQARVRLHDLGYRNVCLRTGDGTVGWPDAAPFDRVIITAAARECPIALWEQLADGGILIGPFGNSENQVLKSIRWLHGKQHVENLTACRFVPLIAD